MTDLTTPALAEFEAWHDQQSPLVRALAAPILEKVSVTLRQMQEVIDTQAAALRTVDARFAELQAMADSLAAGTQSLITAAEAREAVMTTLMEAAEAQQEATKAMQEEHAVALQVAKDRIDQLERHLFGQKSERRPKTPDARKEARKRHRKKLTDAQKTAARQAAAKARRAKLDALRTVVLTLPLTTDVPEGRPLPAQESVIYEWRRGELVRVVVQREQRVLPEGEIVTATPPPQVVEGGSYGPALHAKVAMSKCLDAMPLRRQERAFARLGAPLPISVLCALFHRSAELVEPLYKAMLAEVGAAQHVSADETPQPVLSEDKVKKGWMWVFATDNVVLFTYSPSRGGAVPEAVLGTSQGTLTVDGHTGYNLVTGEGRRDRGGCWSHGRRGLFEARAYDELLVDQLLGEIGELFDVEHQALEQQIVGTQAHLELRQERSAGLVAHIFATVETYVGHQDERSSLSKALRYLLNQREPLCLFLRDARVPIHNNLSERALRIVALLRKTALFVGSDEGGEHLAMLLSMAATCQLHGIDPEPWLADVLVRISEPGSTVDELLPWNWKTGRGPNYTPVFDVQ